MGCQMLQRGMIQTRTVLYANKEDIVCKDMSQCDTESRKKGSAPKLVEEWGEQRETILSQSLVMAPSDHDPCKRSNSHEEACAGLCEPLSGIQPLQKLFEVQHKPPRECGSVNSGDTAHHQ